VADEKDSAWRRSFGDNRTMNGIQLHLGFTYLPVVGEARSDSRPGLKK
jgi:hypothetical protein